MKAEQHPIPMVFVIIERESRLKGDESILSGKSSGKMDY